MRQIVAGAVAMVLILHAVCSLLTVSLLSRLARAGYIYVDADQKHFLDTQQMTGKLFTSRYWHLHNPSLFRRMKRVHAVALLSSITGVEEAEFGFPEKWVDERLAKTIFSGMRSEDIEAIQEKGVCEILGYGMHLNREIFARLNRICAEELVRLSIDNESLLQHLPVEVLLQHERCIAPMKESLFSMPIDSLKKILENASLCRNIDSYIVSNLHDKRIMALFTAPCFGSLRNLQTVDLDNISDFKSEILSHLKTGLTPSTIAKLTKEQVCHIGSQVPAAKVCGRMELRSLDMRSAPGLGSECLANYFASVPYPKLRRLGQLWEKFDDKVLEGCLALDPTLVSRIHPYDYKSMKGHHVNSLFSNSRACAHIDPHARLQIISSTKIGRECFAQLPTNLQPRILVKLSSLHHDVLAKVTSDMMSRWRLESGGERLQGFQVFRCLKSHLSTIIGSLSSDVKSQHACKSIPNVATLIQERDFAGSITKECARALPFSVRAAECIRAPRIWVMQNLSQLSRENVPDQEVIIPHIGADILAILVEENHFCARMTRDFFAMISTEARISISKHCFIQLSFKGKLTAEEMQAMPDNVLAKISAKNFGGLSWKAISAGQMPFLSSEIADENGHALQLLTEKGFAEWEPARISLLTTKQWANVPEEAFAGISSTKIAELKPQVLALWSLNQVKELPDSTLLAMSVEQVAQIGKVADKTAILVFRPLMEQLEEKKIEAVRERIREDVDRPAPDVPVMYIIIALLMVGLLSAGYVLCYIRSLPNHGAKEDELEMEELEINELGMHELVVDK